ncbi:polysaccharide lyase [Ancylobacter mangrovi]|uniref:polysaccharide lyase n=1 Tax=Ancylobacter mangrovi TaxID=2972472 RepID=UPI0021622627|nr:polysaccharide lyase [Ancylobacter mangrovi]MCS0503439.1 polysaccharide lyase [Ancylobacter mangrovi]
MTRFLPRRAATTIVCCAAALAALAAPAGAQQAGAEPTDGRDMVLFDGFEDTTFAPGGGLFYKKNREQGAGSYTFESEVVRSGKQAIDLSVRSQCKQVNGLCSERAEVWEKPEVLVLYGEPVWYAFSMQMAQPIPTERHRYVMAQWKREIDPGADGDFSPLLALRMIDGRIAVTVDTDQATFKATGCQPGDTPASTPDSFSQFRSLVALGAGGTSTETAKAAGFTGCTRDQRVTARGGEIPALTSGWIDFVFQVKPGPNGDGRIDILANGAWVATVEGTIGHKGDGLGSHMYFKFGPYRAGQDGEWRIYYDDFRRGPNCTDVAPEKVCAQVTASAGGVTSATP